MLPPQLVAGGRVFNRYTLDAMVGKGGMGVVWRARDEVLAETVALKFLPESVANDAVAIDELKEETRRARRLTHPHIVRIHDFLLEGGLAAVSMEFVDGATLTQRRLQQPGRVFEAAALGPLVAQLCAALHYAHDTAKIVHRDIKPANILVTDDGQLKVTDFGIARSLSETRTRLTMQGSAGVRGTLPYMSPQQLRGDRPQAADDIYALGATLYELLAGKPPFFRGDANSLIVQIQEKAPPSLELQRAEVALAAEQPAAAAPIPARWEKTILACLAKSPQDRPASAAEVAERLGLAPPRRDGRSTVAGGANGESGAAAGGDNPAKKGRGVFLVVALAVVIVGGAGWWLLRPRESAAPKNVSRPPTAKVVASAATVAPVATNPPAVAAVAREFVVTVEPAEADARLWFGPQAEVAVKEGRAVLKDLPDGELDLAVQAPGFEPFTRKVRVQDGRGSVVVPLVAVRGSLEIAARPGTQVQAIGAQGQTTLLGTVGAGGVLTTTALPVGTYTLRLEHAECEAAELKEVALGVGRTTRLAPPQTPLPGELRVTSEPPGAEVRVNGELVGRTPKTLGKLASEQALRVAVTLPGYRRVEKNVTLAPKETQTFDAGSLVAEAGGIAVQVDKASYPLAEATMKVDGVSVTPRLTGSVWLIDDVTPGKRTLEIAHRNYEVAKQDVVVVDQQNTNVVASPVPKPAVLKFAVTGPREFRVLIDGKETPVANQQTVVPDETPLIVEIRAAGFRPSGGPLLVHPNTETRVQAALEPQPVPKPAQPHTNTLHMKFAPVPGTTALFSIWETRVKDYAIFLYATKQPPRGDSSGNVAEPAIGVTWNDAREFCQWLTRVERAEGDLGPNQFYRLPTDAEWSLAVGLAHESGLTPAEKNHKILKVFPWGTQWPPPAGAGNYAGEESALPQALRGYNDGYARAAPVGSFAANRFGLFDLGGNVWEWCEDEFSAGTNQRTMRGGSFNDSVEDLLLSSVRNHAAASEFHGNLGFRCVLEVGAAP